MITGHLSRTQMRQREVKEPDRKKKSMVRVAGERSTKTRWNFISLIVYNIIWIIFKSYSWGNMEERNQTMYNLYRKTNYYRYLAVFPSWSRYSSLGSALSNPNGGMNSWRTAETGFEFIELGCWARRRLFFWRKKRRLCCKPPFTNATTPFVFGRLLPLHNWAWKRLLSENW